MTTLRDDAGGSSRMIPGARERSTLTYRQPGSMGGPASGSADIPTGPSSMDAVTTVEHQKEGGAVNKHRRSRGH